MGTNTKTRPMATTAAVAECADGKEAPVVETRASGGRGLSYSTFEIQTIASVVAIAATQKARAFRR